MIRAFVALPLPENVRQALGCLRTAIPGAQWATDDNLHLTLHFLGEVPAALLEDIHWALTRIRCPPFALTLRGAGQFARGTRPHALWVGVQASKALNHLQGKVEAAAALPRVRRRFTPHVTLARLATNAPPERVGAFIVANAMLDLGPITCDHFILYESRRGSEGRDHLPLEVYSLSP